MTEIITSTSAPNLGGKSTVRLNRSDFDATIWQKGYEVYHEKAIRCPCKEEGYDNLSSCRNCGGSGWFFINKNKTKMVIQGMNYETEFKEWSEENRGMARITCMDEDQVAFMDRITLRQAVSTYCENLYPKVMEIDGEAVMFAYTVYEILEILDVFAFVSPDVKLTLLVEDQDYTFEEETGKIIMSSKFHSNIYLKLVVRYRHHPQFHILDLTRETMYSDIWDRTTLSGAKTVKFPSSAVARIAHYTLKPKNFDGGYLFDNSYVKNVCTLP